MLTPDSLQNLESLSDRELNRRCYRALFASSRPHWHGSRAELRHRVRSFLRRRRHDRASLFSILRGVAASSVFAVALLGIDVQAAHAADPEFVLSPDPIGGFDVGGNSAPALADLDGDGDRDLVAGAYGGTFLYYENVGSSLSPVFLERTGAANPLDGFVLGYTSTPAFADLDGDGDLDLVAGADSGTFSYFENTGSPLSPAFVARTGVDNPLDGFATPSYYSTPVLVDLDGDGDLDLLAGEYAGSLLYFENTGSAMSPVFVEQSGPASPVDGLSVDGYSAPALGDLDADGDLDLVVGEYAGTFAYFENTGSSVSPVFVARTGVDNPLDGFDVGFNATPAIADLDGDGDLDVVSGEYDGTLRFLENSTPPSPNFIEVTGAANPFDGLSTAGYSAPLLADLDDDGDLDAVSGEYYGTFLYFENTGSASNPVFVERTGAANPFDGIGMGYGSLAALADLDDDGDLDLVTGSYYGTFGYFENTGSASAPNFVEQTGGANPLGGFGVGASSAPSLADLDGDGDFDLVSGEGSYGGLFFYFENTGSPSSPAFVERTGAANPLDGFAIGSFSTPTAVDFDGDLDLDIVSGENNGALFYFENTGSVVNPSFVQRDSLENPFIGLLPGLSSTPALADLDDNGDLELVSGESTGTFVYYVPVPEPRGWMALAPGAALLALLRRTRRKSPGKPPE